MDIYYILFEKTTFFLFQLYLRVYLWIKTFLIIERKASIEEPMNHSCWKYEGILYKNQIMILKEGKKK
jgi:hypothetical protein